MAISNKLLNEGEHIVISTRTHPKVLILPIVLLVLILAFGIGLGAVFGDKGAGVPRIVVWVLALVAFVWFVLRPFLAWWTTTYTFTNRRFMKRSGFVAKEGRTIPLNRISGVDFEMGVIDRAFGCGTLVVSDASTDGSVMLNDIPRIEQVQLRVAEELDRLSRGESRHDDGA